MQVIGDLIKFGDSLATLPLPWWHRAPLGLQSKTWCYVYLMESDRRPLGDLVVSVLDPHKLTETMAVQCERGDEPGVVTAAIDAAKNTNIALAESVTIESGTTHEVTLICESIGQPQLDAVENRLKEAGFSITMVRRYDVREPVWTRRVEVKSGWIEEPDLPPAIAEKYSDNARFEDIDLTKAVVSADTSSRLLRFVFPFRGARSIKVEHRDTPGAMRSVTQVFFKHDLNLLSLLLRRGGAKAGNAILIAACEPKRHRHDPDELYEKVMQDIANLPSKFMAKAEISVGQNAAATISPRVPWTVVARVPRLLLPKVKEERTAVAPGRTPVFFSRRFVNDRRSKALARAVRKALKQSGCEILEATPGEDVHESTLIFLEVSAKMWVAEAGVVFVTSLADADALGKNLPHEFGFLQGQGKPILLLVEGGSADALRPWTNIDGVYAPRFAVGEEALDETSPQSIYQVVKGWAEKLVQDVS